MEKAEAFTTQIIQAWRDTFEWVADSIPGLLRDAEVPNMTFRCGNGYYELLKAIAENKVSDELTVVADFLITDFYEGFAYGIMLSLSEWNEEDDSDRRVDAFLTRVSLDGELRIFAEGSWEETCGVFEYDENPNETEDAEDEDAAEAFEDPNDSVVISEPAGVLKYRVREAWDYIDGVQERIPKLLEKAGLPEMKFRAVKGAEEFMDDMLVNGNPAKKREETTWFESEPYEGVVYKVKVSTGKPGSLEPPYAEALLMTRLYGADENVPAAVSRGAFY